MKTYFKFVIFFFIVMASCDHVVYFDMYVENNCEQLIIVRSKTFCYGKNAQYNSDTIHSHSRKKIHRCSDILGFTIEDINYFIKELEITKDGQNILFNPLDESKWSLTHLSNYQYDAILKVNPEDFE